jgi:uncharacterized membrane protein YgdD (TMEM256/DUF423 family)
MMDRLFFLIASILGGIAVATGAFGAHGLRTFVSAEALGTWDTAVRYQMYHALALFAVAWAISRWPKQVKVLVVGGWLFLAGVVLFSGSLYALVLSDVKQLGAITPIGGVVFVAGWGCLVLTAWRK